MTKNQFRTKTKQLKKEISKLIDNRVEKVINSGCVDFDSYENNFLLPKIFIAAMGDEIKFQFKPLSKEGIEEMKNMSFFL